MATKGIGRPLTILLHADTTGFAKGLAQADSQLKSMNRSLTKASQVASVALASVAAAGMGFAKAAAEDQKSARLLAKTLQNTTKATDAQVKAVEDYISKTSLALGIQDDKLRPSFARLVRSTENAAEAQKLLNLALDVSSATGKPLETVANALGKAYDGNANALGRLGLGIDSATLKTNDFGKIYDDLSGRFKGFAKGEASTAEGSFARLQVAVDEAKESIGYGLLPFVQQLADKLAVAAPYIQANADLILKLGAAVAGTAITVNTLKFAFTTAEVAMKLFEVTAAALKIVTLTLSAATGSAAAAQTLAELTYKRGATATIASTAAAIGYKVAMIAQATASKVATASQWLLNAALSANPIGLVIVAVGLLVGAFVLAYKKIEPFRNLVNSIWEKMKGIVNTIKNSSIGQAVGKLLGIGGARATGGNTMPGKTYLVGEKGPELFTSPGGTITPNNRLSNNGGGTVVNITMNGIVDGESARRSIENLIQKSSRRTGQVSWSGASL